MRHPPQWDRSLPRLRWLLPGRSLPLLRLLLSPRLLHPLPLLLSLLLLPLPRLLPSLLLLLLPHWLRHLPDILSDPVGRLGRSHPEYPADQSRLEAP